MLPKMYQKRDTTLWEYRRRKRGILSPVARGLIFGALFCAWILYCYIFKHGPQFGNEFPDSSVNQFESSSAKLNAEETIYKNGEYHTDPSHNQLNTEEWFHSLKSPFKVSSNGENGDITRQNFEVWHRMGKCEKLYFLSTVDIVFCIQYDKYKYKSPYKVSF